MPFSFSLCGYPLTLQLDGFHGIYSMIAVWMWFNSLLFSPRYFRGHHHHGRYYFFTILTFLATVGVFLSRDLFTAFLFFEVMSFASYPWVAQEETPASLRAAQTYLAVAVFGGMVTLMGLFWLFHLSGSLSFSGLQAFAESLSDRSVLYGPAALTFVGFAAKAGVFPLHIWLPKAHPVAPAPASALLSGILTKTGVFGMIAVSCSLLFGDALWGNILLLLAGITMLLGALMAVFSTDLKHTLACSSMSQIGFILTGLAFTVLLGHENALAARGTMLHMVNHSLIKLDLFLCAGAVFMNTHTLDLTALRGFGRKKPFLHLCFLSGYLGIIGMPLGNGFLSKSLIHEAILEYVAEAGTLGTFYLLYEKLFLFSGGLTAAYMTKLYLCLFWFRNRDEKKQLQWDAQEKYLSPASGLALLLSALPPVLLGLLPNVTARPLTEAAMPFLRGGPLEEAVSWFSIPNLQGAGVSLALGAIVCWMIHHFLVKDGTYLNRWPRWLDLEEVCYRPLAARLLPAIGIFFARACDRVLENPLVRVWIPACAVRITRGLEKMTDHLVLMLRRTLFRPLKIKDYTLSLHEKADLALGESWNRVSPKKDHVALLVSAREEAAKANRYLTRSVSFGLLMLVLGLCVVMVYLLFGAG